jgi:hypothetical protein
MMNLKKKFKPIIIAFSLIGIYNINAHSIFEDMGVGARVPGMGNAFVAVADDVNSVYYNPSGLGNLERPKVMASHAILYSGLSDGSDLGISNMAFALPLQGNRGTVGFLWNKFSLAGLYNEETIHISYGYKFSKTSLLRKFALGSSLKYLSHSFTKTDDAYNPMNGINAAGGVDTVLLGENSKSALDLDIGLLYTLTKKYTIGIAIKGLLGPNMAFSSDTDKLPMKTRIGISHKTLWMILTSQLDFEQGPTGKMDKNFTVAAERTFPSLNKGDIAIRSGLTIGDRDYKQITAGLSYKINKVGFDYGFSMPLGTIKDTTGNHKLAMTYHFGGPTVEEQYAMEVLEQYKELKEKSNYKSTKNVASLDDPRLKEIKMAIDNKNYAKANSLLMLKAKDLLPDTEVLNLSKRLNLINAFYPVVKIDAYSEDWEIRLSSGIENIIKGKDALAIKQINIAQSLNQNDSGLSNFLDKTEELTHLKADRVPSDFNRGYIEYKFYESDLLYDQKKYEDAARKLNQILDFEPRKIAAIKKLGSCHYLMENYALALYYWENALKLETNTKERGKLLKIVNQTKRKINPNMGAVGKKNKLSKQAQNAREIDRLYQLGANLYLKGEHGKASDVFRKIMIMDPANKKAKRALERILRLR